MKDYVIPLVLITISAIALSKRMDLYGTLLSGGREGLRLLFSIIPALVILMTAVGLLRGSGALEALERSFSPAADFLGVPPQTITLLLVRPLSGSAALAVGADLMRTYGPDSLIGKTAAVMLGSTETTFYVVSVYFSAAGIKKSRYTIPAALLADLTGFLTAAYCVRIFERF